MTDGVLRLQDQMKEYADRGEALKDVSFMNYFLDTYDGESVTAKEVDEEGQRRPGRAPNVRIPYREDSKRKGCRVMRTEGHETMLQLVGTWLPRSDGSDREFYCASVLCLLSPWISLFDLKYSHESFESAFQRFEKKQDERTRRVITNLQYFHECCDGARKKRTENVALTAGYVGIVNLDEYDPTFPAHNDQPTCFVLTEESVEAARANRYAVRDQLYGRAALNSAIDVGLFEENPVDTVYNIPARRATWEEILDFQRLGEHLKAVTKSGSKVVELLLTGPVPTPGVGVTRTVHPAVSRAFEEPPIRSQVAMQRLAMLNESQRRAHDIIENHLMAHKAGRSPPQLLMVVQGEGGTGKTVLINALADTFDFHGASDLLGKTATTGVAASLIGGQTLHTWAGIPVFPSQSDDWMASSSKVVKERRKRNIIGVEYLEIDEFSMLTKELLTIASQVIGSVRTQADCGDRGKPFGGMNIILFGDLHQFPPVGGGNLPLYALECRNSRAEIGREIFKQFTTVVNLTEQMRTTDPEWCAILRHLRTGSCSEEELEVIASLRLNPGEDYGTAPWSDAILVTPRHSSRAMWNAAAVKRHCAKTGNRLYISPAEDTTGREARGLTLEERVIVAGMKTRQTARLEDCAHIAVGMKAMVVLNISTEGDVANGTRGTVAGIVLDPREPENHELDENSGGILLKYPPALVLFKPDGGTAERFQNVEEGLIPLVPSKESFTIVTQDGKSHTVARRQMAITPGYAFTDYKSQGQTIEYVIVDLAKPPSGAPLTPFNAYVALSRSRGRHSIRILREYDERLFTEHPSEDLRMEDERLSTLADQTTQNAALGVYHW